MFEEPVPQVRPQRLVRCPECGEAHVPRGIAAHRRMRHGIESAARTELAGTLARLAGVLESLDSRLNRVERAVATEPPVQKPAPPAAAPRAVPPTPASAPTSAPAPTNADPREIQRRLDEVLAEIARVKQETEQQLSEMAGRTLPGAQRRLEETAYHVLGDLRRRQANLIYELQKMTKGDGFDALASM